MLHIDPLLLYLAGFTERFAKDGCRIIPVELHLHVGGFLIIGTLISSIEFEERSHKAVKKLLEIQADTHEELARLAQTSIATIEGGAPQFIHLGDVQFWTPSKMERWDGPSTECWRIRLSSIDAFCVHDPEPTESVA